MPTRLGQFNLARAAARLPQLLECGSRRASHLVCGTSLDTERSSEDDKEEVNLTKVYIKDLHSDGLQPNSNGLQATRDGLQPNKCQILHRLLIANQSLRMAVVCTGKPLRPPQDCDLGWDPSEYPDRLASVLSISN